MWPWPHVLENAHLNVLKRDLFIWAGAEKNFNLLDTEKSVHLENDEIFLE